MSELGSALPQVSTYTFNSVRELIDALMPSGYVFARRFSGKAPGAYKARESTVKMGIMDDVTGAFSRGTSAAERAARSTRLRADLKDVNRQRQNLAAQLGASLYEVTRENPEFREGREELYQGIARCDQKRDEANRALQALRDAAAAEEAARQSFPCGVCGAPIRGDDLFCSGCGTPAEKARIAQAASATNDTSLRCAACGAPLGSDYVFCMECGALIRSSSDEEIAVQAEDEALQENASASVGPCCPSCGTSVENGQAFCMACGAALVEPESE